MSVKVFDLLTATPAPVSGKPTPTRSFQWLRNGTAISGANAQTYMLQPADEGALVAVRQIETNLLGKATATSATVGPIIPDTTALDYIAAVEAADGEPLEEGVKQAYIDFIVGCKQDGIFQSLKASCIMAGARTLEGALVPLVGNAPTNFNFVPADYDRVTGLKGDGATKYLDSNRKVSDDPQNNAHLSVYVTTPETQSAAALIGGFETTDSISQILRSGGANRALLNTEGSGLLTLGSNIPSGIWVVSRTSASDISARVGTANASRTDTTSVAPADVNIFVFARNFDGLSIPSNARLSFYSIGEALDIEALDTRVSNLMTAIDEALT